MNVLLALAAAVLFGVGTYLVLQRQLSRIVIGLGLLAHGANVLFVLAAQGRGRAPFLGEEGEGAFTDPLPQALVLTAIVITFGVTAFLLALAYRSWIVTHDDEVEDDLEDRVIARGESADLAGNDGTGDTDAARHPVAPDQADDAAHAGVGPSTRPHRTEDSP